MRPERRRREALCVADLRRMAKRVLPRPIFDFADGGAQDERTLRRNEQAFDGITLLPRPLNGAAERDLSLELFGRRISMPVIIGPTGLAGLFWPMGEQAAARAAASAGTAYCLSHGSVCALEAIPSGNSPRWMQVFIYRDRGFTRELAERASASGYGALVLTVDNQLLGRRERDLRNGFAIPPRYRASEVFAMATKLPWLLRMRRELPASPSATTPGPAKQPESKNSPAGWRGFSTRPCRGLTSTRCAPSGRGRWFLKASYTRLKPRRPWRVASTGWWSQTMAGGSLTALRPLSTRSPAVVDAVEGRIPVLLDGGIRRGVDVVKALSLGAAACLIGRPQLWGLAVAGEAGVAHVLALLRQEIDLTMGLMGASRLGDLGQHCLSRQPASGGCS